MDVISVAKSWLEDGFEVNLKYVDCHTLAYSTILTCAELLNMFACNRSVTFVKCSIINWCLYTTGAHWG